MCIICVFSFVAVVVANIPVFLSYDIRWIETTTNCNDDKGNIRQVPFITQSDMIFANDCLLLRIIYISSGLLFNALPCALLICFSIGRIVKLRTV
ncbi:hypothetical protein PMAYCL1PPCAC_16366, partial [Pristionchus mayeri]